MHSCIIPLQLGASTNSRQFVPVPANNSRTNPALLGRKGVFRHGFFGLLQDGKPQRDDVTLVVRKVQEGCDIWGYLINPRVVGSGGFAALSTIR
jgi:hypothetical protein